MVGGVGLWMENIAMGGLESFDFNGFALYIAATAKAQNAPNKPAPPTGPTIGKVGQTYEYSSSTTDPDGDQLFYQFLWNDGTNSGIIGPFESGETVTVSHKWTKEGSYSISVQAFDSNLWWAQISEPLQVEMIKGKSTNQRQLHILSRFFDRLWFTRLLKL